MASIGIFGGSFNPIHNGHIALARQLRRQTALDEVWLMVSPQNPLKQEQDLLEDHLRMQMAQKALEGERGVEGLRLRVPPAQAQPTPGTHCRHLQPTIPTTPLYCSSAATTP